MDNKKMLRIKLTSEYGQRWSSVTKKDLEESLRPDLSKLKEGDEVWIRGEVHEGAGGRYVGNEGWDGIIAHFPKEERAGLPKKITRASTCESPSYGKFADAINGLIDYLKEKEDADGQ